MGNYKVVFKPSIEKDLKKLPKEVVVRALGRIQTLADTPFPPGAVKLSGADRLYRLRVGDYRVVYEVEKEREVVIVHYVRHRQEAYRRLP